MGTSSHKNVSRSIHFPIPPWCVPIRRRSFRRIRRLPLWSIRHDRRGDQEGPRGRGEGFHRCRGQAQGVHGGREEEVRGVRRRREEEVRGLRGCTEEGRGGCHCKGEGALREAWTICLWPIRPIWPLRPRLWLWPPRCLRPLRLWLPRRWLCWRSLPFLLSD